MTKSGGRVRLLVVLGVAVSLLATACGARAFHAVRTPAWSVSRTIVIRPELGMTFGSPPVKAAPRLTAAQAWAAYMRHIGHSDLAIPTSVTARLGLFTLPLGPREAGVVQSYRAHNELAYGFSWHSCPISLNPAVRKPPPGPCIEWNFVDANTGTQIAETWQTTA